MCSQDTLHLSLLPLTMKGSQKKEGGEKKKAVTGIFARLFTSHVLLTSGDDEPTKAGA